MHRTTALVAAGLVGLIIVVSASAALKPKPWQWTERKAATRLTAMGPTTFDVKAPSVLDAYAPVPLKCL
jgi:hypothetical protein